MSNLSKNDPQNIEQNFDELELVAEKAGELNDRVGKIESELGAQTKTLESAALVLDAAIKGLGALKSSVLENDIGALQLALNDKTAHLAREIGRFESAVAEIDRRAESGDDEIKAALLATAQSLRAQFDAKSAEIGEWSARVEKEIAAHSVALAAIPPIIKGADAVGFNPVGEWETGKAFARMDVVSYAGSSYISNVDGNTEKPSKSKNYTVLSKRAGSIGSGGVGGFAELTGTILPAQVVPGSATYAVGDVLYAGTTGALSKLGAGSSGQLLSTQGAGAAPIWVTATGGAGDMNGPASATDNAIARFDGTGGKTVQNSAVTIADTTGAIAGASSLTAPASTDLTLTGGSTGASLVLGQGASAGNASLFTTGTGVVKLGDINGGSQVWLPGFTTVTGYNSISLSRSSNYGDLMLGRNLTGDNTQTTDSYFTPTTQGAGGYGGIEFQYGGTTRFYASSGATTAGATVTPALRMTLAETGNLLIGTTTDAASLAGGLVVNGSGAGAAASSTTTGALRVTGGVGVSGAGYFGGSVNGADALRVLTSGTPIGSFQSAAGDLYISLDQNANGNMIFRRNSGTEAMRITGSNGAINITSTVSASSATTGALTIGNGSAATNVAIGGGNVWAGAAILADSYISAGSHFNAPATGDFRLGATYARVAKGDGVGGFVGGYNVTFNSGVKHDSTGAIAATYYATSTGINWYSATSQVAGTAATPAMTLAMTGVLSIASTSPSTGLGSGALQVAGGIYAGAASVFGGAVTANGQTSLDTAGAVSRALIVGPVAQSGGNLPYASIKTSIADFGLAVENTNAVSGQGLGLRIVAGATASDLPLYVRDRTNATTLFSVGGTGAATFAGAVSIGNTVSSVSPTSPNRTITIVVGGVTLYIAAKTTND